MLVAPSNERDAPSSVVPLAPSLPHPPAAALEIRGDPSALQDCANASRCNSAGGTTGGVSGVQEDYSQEATETAAFHGSFGEETSLQPEDHSGFDFPLLYVTGYLFFLNNAILTNCVGPRVTLERNFPALALTQHQ